MQLCSPRPNYSGQYSSTGAPWKFGPKRKRTAAQSYTLTYAPQDMASWDFFHWCEATKADHQKNEFERLQPDTQFKGTVTRKSIILPPRWSARDEHGGNVSPNSIRSLLLPAARSGAQTKQTHMRSQPQTSAVAMIEIIAAKHTQKPRKSGRKENDQIGRVICEGESSGDAASLPSPRSLVLGIRHKSLPVSEPLSMRRERESLQASIAPSKTVSAMDGKWTKHQYTGTSSTSSICISRLNDKISLDPLY